MGVERRVPLLALRGLLYVSKAMRASEVFGSRCRRSLASYGTCAHSVNVLAWNNNGYSDSHQISNQSWGENCCIFAAMTTIAQNPPNNEFGDGSEFGPVNWGNDDLCYVANGPYGACSYRSLVGGAQSWPNNPTRVIATQSVIGGEQDTICLHHQR
jgi:hypothetical protein